MPKILHTEKILEIGQICSLDPTLRSCLIRF